MVNALLSTSALGRVGEDERLYRDRHGTRRQSKTTEVDVIEIPQRQAVNDEDLVIERHVLAKYGTEIHGDVGIENDVDGPTVTDATGKTSTNPLGQGLDPLILGASCPTKREDDVSATSMTSPTTIPR